MSDQKRLEELKGTRGVLQLFECIDEIAISASALTGLLCLGAWIGIVAPNANKREIVQVGIGGSMALVGVAWADKNRLAKKLHENWKEICDARKPKSICDGCVYKSNSEALPCAVHPIEQPNDCPDKRVILDSQNEVSFQDSSGLNVVVIDGTDSEVEEIQQMVYRVFNS